MGLGETITKRILDLCKDRDISINKLCTISGVTQSTVNNIISGRNGSTTVSTIKKLCDCLEITLGEFFSTEDFDRLDQEIR
jgi:transcriptional regulator with XRE-family HTH domain